MQVFENKTFDAERALYGVYDAEVINCEFAGPADGESALKECSNVKVKNSRFLLRYPLWHLHGGSMADCVMTDTCRAAMWYDSDLTVENTKMGGIKAVRECDNTVLKNCDINSEEFGWFCRGIQMENCKLVSVYPFLQSRNLQIDRLNMQAKYSFQYVENVTIKNSVLDTKDAFWHSKNVTVIDSIVKGEYLAWYSENLHFIRCKITGTQPLCYAKGLVLEDCTMEGCELAFEYSDVQADIKGSIDSVKNPRSGYIKAAQIGEIILDEHQVKDGICKIETTK